MNSKTDRSPAHAGPVERPGDVDPWAHLAAFTPARIALGRAGSALPTRADLALRSAHAEAHTAVHRAFEVGPLGDAIRGATGLETVVVQSRADTRAIYLQRPDLGRSLSPSSREALAARRTPPGFELVIVVAGGLSPLAAERHAVPLLTCLLPAFAPASLRVAPVVLAEEARVALGDGIAEALGGELVLVLLGERPGLTAADSLGAYLTYAPRPGRTDAERNCLSNIRPAGLSYEAAAHKLGYLIAESRRRKLTGVSLKDEAELLLPR